MADGQERLHEALMESASRASPDERARLAHSRFLREMGPPPPEHH
jgi:hypothetical protein